MIDPNKLHGVFKAILNGLHQRGEGGVLYVKGDECAYRFVHEFVNLEFRGALETVVDADAGNHFFVVEERDKQLHVLAYPKTRVWAECGADQHPLHTATPDQPPSVVEVEEVEPTSTSTHDQGHDTQDP